MIKKITKENNNAIAELILKCLTEFEANKEGFAAKDPELYNLYEFYQKINGQYFIIEINGKLVGGAGLAPLKGAENDSTWELQKMYLDKDVRGLGLGKKILAQCINYAKNKKIAKLYIETLNSMTAANILYQKFGFRSVEKPLGNTGHFGCDKYYLLEL